MKRAKGEAGGSKERAFQQYQYRRSADGFEQPRIEEGGASRWERFIGSRGHRLKGVLDGFALLTNPAYQPSPEASHAFVRDAMQRLGAPLPVVPAMRLCEWLASEQGGRAAGWLEVPPGMAQAAANDGRPALVVGFGPLAASLAAVVYPDRAASASNPTVMMVGAQLALVPGTMQQGFEGYPVRFFAHGG